MFLLKCLTFFSNIIMKYLPHMINVLFVVGLATFILMLILYIKLPNFKKWFQSKGKIMIEVLFATSIFVFMLFNVTILYNYRIKQEELVQIDSTLEKGKETYCSEKEILDELSVPQNVLLKDLNDVIYYPQQVNLYDSTGCEDYFYDYDGSIVEAQNGSYMSNWIQCSPGDYITRNGFATNVVCYFDADKNFIQRVDSYGLSTIKVPDNKDIAFVRLAVQPSDSRVIVYGEKISEYSLAGDYYQVPNLKISDRNIIDNKLYIQSANGKKWKIIVNNDGSISSEDVSDVILPSELPVSFPDYKVIGRGKTDDDYLLMVNTTEEASKSYLIILSSSGEIKWYREIEGHGQNFRKIVYDDGTVRYAYGIVVEQVSGINGGIYNTKIILMDENYQIINDDIRPLPYGSIVDVDQCCENHDYKILGDNHYILTTVTKSCVTNIPGMEDKDAYVVNAIIQEQKDGKVVMQWESIEHPELYEASIINNDFANTNSDNYTDYVHLNSVVVDPKTLDLLVSCRSIGVIKVDRKNGNILWIMGRGKNDISGLDEESIGLYQHDARYCSDGSITIFDNSGGAGQLSRVCRYWINEDKLCINKVEVFQTQYKSTSTGNTTLIDEESNTYLINYGTSNADFSFEERDMNNNIVNMKVQFNDCNNIYRIFIGKEETPTKLKD